MSPELVASITALVTALAGLVTALIAVLKALRNERDIRDTDQRGRDHIVACHTQPVVVVPTVVTPPDAKPATGKQ